MANIASQAEAEAGTATDKFMTPQRTQQAIDALGGGGVTAIAQVDLTSGSPTAVTLASGISGAREIHLWLKDVSTNSANTPMLLQIGDSGGIETTGYDANASSMHGSSTSGSNNQDTDGRNAVIPVNSTYAVSPVAAVAVGVAENKSLSNSTFCSRALATAK